MIIVNGEKACVCAKVAKINELSKDCENEITNTLFESSALGTVHSYDCTEKAELTLAGICGSGAGGYIYAHAQPKFTLEFHTDAQSRTVSTDMQRHIKEHRVIYADKAALVNAIADDDVDFESKLSAITW